MIQGTPLFTPTEQFTLEAVAADIAQCHPLIADCAMNILGWETYHNSQLMTKLAPQLHQIAGKSNLRNRDLASLFEIAPRLTTSDCSLSARQVAGCLWGVAMIIYDFQENSVGRHYFYGSYAALSMRHSANQSARRDHLPRAYTRSRDFYTAKLCEEASRRR